MIDEVNKQTLVNKDIEDIFIDENDLFDGDDVSPDNKKFIMDLIDRTNFADERKIYNGADELETDFISQKIKTKKKMDQDEVNKGNETPENAAI